MADPTKTRPRDSNQLAHRIFLESIGEAEVTEPPKVKSVAPIGRPGGLKGGVARAAALSPAKRSEIAAKAAAKRWKKPDA